VRTIFTECRKATHDEWSALPALTPDTNAGPVVQINERGAATNAVHDR
jgi:hypothetical protein